MVVPRFNGMDAETLLGLFDGQSMTNGGSKVAKFLAENMALYLADELGRLKGDEDAADEVGRVLAEVVAEGWRAMQVSFHNVQYRRWMMYP